MEAKGDPHYPLRPESANVDGPMRETVVKLGKMRVLGCLPSLYR